MKILKKLTIILAASLCTLAFAKGEEKKKVKNIVLSGENSVIIRGPITGSSLMEPTKKLLEISSKLKKEDPIYLVLDTPGGSVIDGMNFIRVVKSLPQKVHTINLTSISMGFIMMQSLGTRYVVEDSIIMSHRARVGTRGQLPGELDSRYRFFRTLIVDMEKEVSKRLRMTRKKYIGIIWKEWWLYGARTLKAKVADEVVTVTCKDYKDTYVQTVYSLFGKVEIEWSSCGIVSVPLSIESKGWIGSAKDLHEVIRMYTESGPKSFNNYIKTGLYRKYLK